MDGIFGILRNTKKDGGVRRRWIRSSVSVVFLILIAAVFLFSAVLNLYYSIAIQTVLKEKATAISSFFICRSESEYYQNANLYLSLFSERGSLELQFLQPSGRIQLSSSGLAAGQSPGTADIALAADTAKAQSYIGKDTHTAERIASASSPIFYDGSVVGIVRVVTSLRLIETQILFAVVRTVLIGVLILGIIYASNLYFIRSITEPVTTIIESAKRIADGSYGVQIEKRFNDEIGMLADTINDMSCKIRQSEKVKSEFISSVSHELRTPLTAINGWAETIMNGEVRGAEDVRKGMGIIVGEARRLANMVEELLEFSRIEDGRFTLSVEQIDLREELEDAVYTYREFFRKEEIELCYEDSGEDFPLVPADPERMRQVFCNLLDNAAKHGGSGKRIDASIEQAEEMLVVRIRDYGPGVPDEELPHVKYRFYKGSSKARGNGIGLAVCEEIVTRHGGKLDISNAEGGGCLVTIHLPIHSR